MKLFKVRMRLGRDMLIDLICECCEHVDENVSAYDDENYWYNVLPGVECKNCKENAEFLKKINGDILFVEKIKGYGWCINDDITRYCFRSKKMAESALTELKNKKIAMANELIFSKNHKEIFDSLLQETAQ